MANFDCPFCKNLLTDVGLVPGQLLSCPYCNGHFTAPALPAIQPDSLILPAQQQPVQQVSYIQNVHAAPVKNSGVAAVLSFFYVGLGQIYNGQIAKGLMLLFCPPVVACIVFIMTIVGVGVRGTPDPPTVNLAGTSYPVTNIPPEIEQHLSPKSRALVARLRQDHRDATSSAAVSSAAGLAGGFVLIMVLAGVSMFCIWIFSMFDAYQTAEKINRRAARL